MPLGTRAAAVVAGGLGGGTAFVIENYVNSMAQKKMQIILLILLIPLPLIVMILILQNPL